MTANALNTDELKRTWALAEAVGPDVPLYFYSHLFMTHPEVRQMFPVSMATQRDRLFTALGRIVSEVDQLENVVGYIEQLGRDHRRFSVVAEHYDAVGASLLATLKQFLGEQWPAVADDWAAAYGVIASTMVRAADESAAATPAVWRGEVFDVDRRSLELAVLQVQLDEPYPFRPGQAMAVEVPQLPRMWRYYSPANAPRDDNSIELHVQLVPGGQVSGALVGRVAVGDVLTFGAPVGNALTLADDHDQDLLMVAGSSGLAPLRGHLENLDRRAESGTGPVPRVRLFHGARTPQGLYEDELLRGLATRSWFDYTAVVSDDPRYEGARGYVGSVAARSGDWRHSRALVCGSPAMVEHTVSHLRDAGVPDAAIRREHFGSPVTEYVATPVQK